MKIIKDNKLLLKILSALIAIVLWFAITYTEDPAVNQHLTNINAVFSGEPLLRERGLTVVNKDKLPAFSAVVRGNRSKVISSLGIVSASIDVSRITEPGTHEVFVEYKYPQDAVVLTKAKISSVSVEVEKILSRDIPVRIEADANTKDTDRLVALESNAQTITVRGAQSVVEKISYAKATIDTSDVTAGGTMNYSYKLYDENDNVLDEKNIISKSESTVPVTGTVYKKTDVPVEIVLSDNLKANYTLKVKKQSVSKLTVGLPDSVFVSALYAVLGDNATKERSPATLNITIPDGVYFPGEDLEVVVEYELLPKTVHDVEVTVTAENVPEGREVTISPEKVKIAVKCSKSDAVASKISATLNAENLEEGVEKTVTLNVATEDNMEVVGSYTATAVLH